MNSTSSISAFQRFRLLGKELRQLRPLLAVAPLVFLLGAITLTGAESWGFLARGFPREFIYQLPSLIFALGAVGLMVSQEKEQRSVHWLASLPIAAREIVQIKWWAGAMGLLIVWSGCIAAAALLQTWFPSIRGVEAWVLTLLSHVYILSIGLAIAWRLNSPLAVLFGLLAVAFLPALLAQVLYSLLIEGWWTQLDKLNSERVTWVLQVLSYAAGTLLAVTLMFRWGTQALSAQPTGPAAARWDWAPYSVSRSNHRPQRILTASSGLLWQATRQQAGLLLGISALFAVALVNYSLRGSPMASGWLAALAICWLGAGVFVGESSRRQVRFLADRGISPLQVWWTRQAPPLGLLSAFWLLTLGVVCTFSAGDPLQAVLWADVLWLLFLSSLVLYAASQWLSQQIRSPILAMAVAPMVSGTLFVSITSWLDWMQLSAVWISGAIAVPLLLTCWSTRRWLEQQLSPWSATVQAGLIVGGLVIALFGKTGLPPSSPSLPAELQVEFNRLSQDAAPRALPWYADGPTRRENLKLNPAQTSEGFSMRLELLDSLGHIEQELAQSNHPLRGDLYFSDGYDLELLAELTRRWQDDAVELQTTYRRAIRAHFDLVRRVRQSEWLIDQAAADVGEIWLLRQLLKPERAAALDDELYNQLVAYLSDVESRRSARRRAIVAAWDTFVASGQTAWWRESPNEFGGIYLATQARLATWEKTRQQQDLVKQLVKQLWALSEGPDLDHQASLLALATLLGQPVEFYGQGQLGHYFRIEDVLQATRAQTHRLQDQLTPGQQWSAGWEQQAQQLPLRPSKPEAARPQLPPATEIGDRP